MKTSAHSHECLHDVTTPSTCIVPLDTVVSARQGGVPAQRIGRILLDLAADLEARHTRGTVHGRISYHHIALDQDGVASWCEVPTTGRDHLLPEECCQPASCGLAFEQLTHNAGWPIGPWTDVYGLSALVYRLITGECPPCAIDRCLADDYRPLTARGLTHYDPRFLRAIDEGLNFVPAQRPQSLSDFLTRAGLLSSRTGPMKQNGRDGWAGVAGASAGQRARASAGSMVYGPWSGQPKALDLGQRAAHRLSGLPAAGRPVTRAPLAQVPPSAAEAADEASPVFHPGSSPTRSPNTPVVALLRQKAGRIRPVLAAAGVVIVAAGWVSVRYASPGQAAQGAPIAVAGHPPHDSGTAGMPRTDPYVALLDSNVQSSAAGAMGPALHASLWALTAVTTQSELAPHPRRAPFAPLAGIDSRPR